jgi:hypothetical protein
MRISDLGRRVGLIPRSSGTGDRRTCTHRTDSASPTLIVKRTATERLMGAGKK